MDPKKTILGLLLGMLLAIVPWAARAERSVEFGDYVIHYNAFNSSILQPDVAQRHGIVRSRYRALVNVAALKKVPGTTGEPVSASVTGTATNLSGQQRQIGFQEVREGTAVYYLGDLRIDNDQEVVDFDLQVEPEGKAPGTTIRFRQTFFTEE